MHVFIDESGSHNAPIAGDEDRYFVLAAVTVSERKLDETRERMEKIRLREMQQGELKSSKIADNLERRLRILSQLGELPMGLHIVAIDKKTVVDGYPGYEFKKVFFKNVRMRLLRVLKRDAFNLVVKIDEYGRSEFMDECVRYLQSKLNSDLFAQGEYFFASSKDDVMIQAADFYAGSFRKFCEGRDQRIFQQMASKIIRFEWLDRGRPQFVGDEHPEDEDAMSAIITQVSERHALDFMSETLEIENDDVVSAMRQVCSDLMVALLDDPQLYLPGAKLRDSIAAELGLEGFSEEKFKSEVIAGLRDKGVIIATSNKGYKLPSGRKDLTDFSKHVAGMLLPYLRRLKMARETYRTATSGAMDILAGDELKGLKTLVENMNRFEPPEEPRVDSDA